MPPFTANKIYFEAFGQGKPLITISGIPSDHRIIMSWMEPIFEQRSGWQRFYFDLPGTGQSDADGIESIDRVLDMVCNFIDAVLPGQRFTLLGLSVGGYLAYGVVLRKATLIDGVCLLVPWLGKQDEQTLPSATVMFRDPEALAQLSPEDAQKLESLAVVQSQKVVDWYRDTVILARQGGQGPTLNQKTYSFDLLNNSSPFEKPALIITSRQDTHVGYQDAWQLLEQYPHATFAVLDRAGHALGVEQENLFQTLIHEWLDRVEETQLNQGT